MADEYPVPTPAGTPKRPDFKNLISTDVAAADDVGFAAQLEQGAKSRQELQQIFTQSGRFPLSGSRTQ